MATSISPFIAQFEEDELEEAKTTFAQCYGAALACDWLDNPLDSAIAEFCESYECEIEPEPADLELWIEEMKEEVQLARVEEEVNIKQQRILDTFRTKRGTGQTFMQAAKATGEDPAYVLAVLDKAGRYELKPEQLTALRQAYREDEKAKSYKARRKLYRMLGRRVETALADADFSELPVDKLFAMALRLAELSREDGPVEETVSINYTHL